jgi:hypothetical protein
MILGLLVGRAGQHIGRICPLGARTAHAVLRFAGADDGYEVRRGQG